MSSDADARIAAMLRRVTLTGIDASGPQHLIDARGIRGESFARMPRLKEFGLSSSPPTGSTGLALSLGGRADRAMMLGLDHADHGPRDLSGGHTAIYDAFGNMISLVEHSIRLVAATRAEIIAPLVVVTSPDIRLGSEAAAARVMTEAGPAQKVRAE